MSLNSLQSERNICVGSDEGRFWKPTCSGLHLDFHLLVDLRFFIWGRVSLHSQHPAGDLVRAEGVRERMFVLCLMQFLWFLPMASLYRRKGGESEKGDRPTA